MRIVEFAVQRWQLTVIVFVMLAALGIASWQSIPRAEDPVFPIPSYTIVVVNPGASPEDLERLVVKPIEERLSTLDDRKKIDATMEDGLATIFIEFDANVDAERKYDEVLREVNAVRNRLPTEIALLDVKKSTSLAVAIAQLALVSPTAPYAQLDSLAKTLEERLETVAGVRGAERWAAPRQQARVSVDLGRLAQTGLGAAQLLQAIGSESADIPGGSLDAGRRRLTVKTSGSYTDLNQLRATVVGTAAGQLVRVGDVADVQWADADLTHIGRWNGARAVFVTATQREGQRIGDVRDRLWAELDRFERELPAGITLARGFDQSVNVSNRLARLGVDFGLAILLVLVTLLPLGPRAALVVMISIPLSLAIGATALNALGFSINQLSIVGFVIALGLLVDDSIVVVENIARFLREGRSRREAAILATKQIGVAVTGCTATLLFAFLPLLLLPGSAGDYIRSLPMAVIVTVLASLFVSLTIVPWLASLLLRETDSHEGGRVLRAVTRGIERTYAPILDRALAAPRRALALAALLVAGVFALAPLVGFSLFPKAESPQVRVDIRLPDGASLAATDAAARFAERVVGGHPEVRGIFTSVGRDNPQVYYNVFPKDEKANVGQLFVLLHRYDPATTPAVLDAMRRELAAYPGARLELREFENGPPITAPIALRISGPDLDTLRLLAGRVETIVRRTDGTEYVDNPLRLRRTDLQLVIDRNKAGLLGVPVVEIDRQVRLGLEGLVAGTMQHGEGDAREVRVRLTHASARPAPESLERIFVPTASGAATPLMQVAQLRATASPPSIQRYDKARTVTIASDVRTGYNTDRITQRILAAVDSLVLPVGYRVVAGGEVESRAESFGGLGTAIIVAVFGILAILVLEFGSFTSTLIVASVIPLGVIGGILALLVTGFTFSFTAMIGFVALIGIEIKTSILLVDFTNQLRAEGMPLEQAIRRAGEVRFLPILLTSLTAIGGLLPVALQGVALYAPLAWVIIGGLISSTLLARLVTPVLYKLLPPPVEVRGLA